MANRGSDDSSSVEDSDPQRVPLRENEPRQNYMPSSSSSSDDGLDDEPRNSRWSTPKSASSMEGAPGRKISGLYDSPHTPENRSQYTGRPSEANENPVPSVRSSSRRAQAERLRLLFESLDQDTRATRVRITVWEQECLKFVFPTAFAASLSILEFIPLICLLFAVVVNATCAFQNVFGGLIRPAFEDIAIVTEFLFIAELVIIFVFFVLFVVTAIYGCVRGLRGMSFAADLVDVAQLTAGFSSLKLVTFTFSLGTIRGWFRRLSEHRNVTDVLLGILFAVLWVGLVILSGVVVLLKANQLDFIRHVHPRDWEFGHLVLIAGFTLNIIMLETAYDASGEMLLRATNSHFMGPGSPVRRNGLFTELCRGVGWERPHLYAYFEAVFRHYEYNLPPHQQATTRILNSMATLLHIDRDRLLQFLQMVQSPLRHYDQTREIFNSRLAAGAVEDLEQCVWRANPRSEHLNRKYMRLRYRCEDIEAPENNDLQVMTVFKSTDSIRETVTNPAN